MTVRRRKLKYREVNDLGVKSAGFINELVVVGLFQLPTLRLITVSGVGSNL